MELMTVEQALTAYGLAFKDIRRAGIKVYTWINGGAEEYTDSRVYGSLSDLYISKQDFLELKGVRSTKRETKAKKNVKPKTVINLKKKKGPWTGYSPKKPAIED